MLHPLIPIPRWVVMDEKKFKGPIFQAHVGKSTSVTIQIRLTQLF